MSEFNRRLDNLDKLRNDASAWWWDLLSLWTPSGKESGEYGLRLAIRDNYLNFYRRGQSIARVQIGSDGLPSASIHHKYLHYLKDEFDTTQLASQTYLRLEGTSIVHKGSVIGAYRGVDDLKSWIRTINGNNEHKGYVGVEKCWVDQIVASNPDIIDLEMGLPAWKGCPTAPRMDIVALEQVGEKIAVVFWEAKLASDGRVRTKGEIELGKKPEVLKQLENYQNFLAGPGHKDGIVAAYRRVARLFTRLRAMADRIEDSHPLGELIEAVANGAELVVGDKARLVVLDDSVTPQGQAAWVKHASKLRQANVTMQAFSSKDEIYRLVNEG